MESVAKSLAAEKTRLSLMQMPVASTVQITVWGAETFLCLCSVMHRVFKDQRYSAIIVKEGTYSVRTVLAVAISMTLQCSALASPFATIALTIQYHIA